MNANQLRKAALKECRRSIQFKKTSLGVAKRDARRGLTDIVYFWENSVLAAEFTLNCVKQVIAYERMKR